MPITTRSSVYIEYINPQPLFDPIGDVTRYFEARLRGVERRAIANAPDGADSGRTQKSRYNPEPFGYLKESIFGELSHGFGLQIAFEVRAEARYALFVIKGTGPVIRAGLIRVPAGETRTLPDGRTARGGTFAPGTRGMVLPPNFGYRAGVRVQSVRGQRPNDFLSRAVNEEAAAHSALLSYDRT